MKVRWQRRTTTPDGETEGWQSTPLPPSHSAITLLAVDLDVEVCLTSPSGFKEEWKVEGVEDTSPLTEKLRY